jgi:hypothetical protein
MRHNIICCFLWILLTLSYPERLFALNDILHHVPNAQLTGKGTLSVFFMHIYDATLYTSNGQMDNKQPFILSITYHHHFSGSDIVDRSIQEIKLQGFLDKEKLDQWYKDMKTIIPDVHKGTVLTALFIPGEKTIFYHDADPVGQINDPDFTKQFANIWLGERTSKPTLRNQLLGKK